MRYLPKFFAIIFLPVSMYCWAPHFSEFSGTRLETYKLVAPDSEDGDEFAYGFSIDTKEPLPGEHGIIAVSSLPSYSRSELIAAADTPSGPVSVYTEPGSVYLFEFSGSSWDQVAKIDGPRILEALLPPEPPVIIPIETGFGASVLIHGNLLFVGATKLEAVKVFRKIGTTGWHYEGDVIPDDATYSTTEFGRSIQLVDDNLVIAAEGAVYVYGPGTAPYKWDQKQVLHSVPFDPMYGADLDLSDGTLAVGSMYGVFPGGPISGVVELFEYDISLAKFLPTGSVWPQDLHPAHSEFGHAVSVSGDDMLITHSRYTHGVVGECCEAGTAYTYEKAGNAWALGANSDAYKERLDTNNPVKRGEFGWDGDILGDLAVITDSYYDLDGISSSGWGVGHLFVRGADGSWNHNSLLSTSDAEAGTYFGDRVGITKGGLVLISDHNKDLGVGSDGDGALYIYDLAHTHGFFSEKVPALGTLSLLLALLILGFGAAIKRGK